MSPTGLGLTMLSRPLEAFADHGNVWTGAALPLSTPSAAASPGVGPEGLEPPPTIGTSGDASTEPLRPAAALGGSTCLAGRQARPIAEVARRLLVVASTSWLGARLFSSP